MVGIQTQCCLSKRDDEWEDDEDGDSAQEWTAVQLVEPLPWHGRSGDGPAGAAPRPQAAVPRSLSDAHTDQMVGGPFKSAWT